MDAVPGHTGPYATPAGEALGVDVIENIPQDLDVGVREEVDRTGRGRVGIGRFEEPARFHVSVPGQFVHDEVREANLLSGEALGLQLIGEGLQGGPACLGLDGRLAESPGTGGRCHVGRNYRAPAWAAISSGTAGAHLEHGSARRQYLHVAGGANSPRRRFCRRPVTARNRTDPGVARGLAFNRALDQLFGSDDPTELISLLCTCASTDA